MGQLGWSLRRIEATVHIRRETISGYLRAAGIPIRPSGGWGRLTPAKPAIQVITDSAMDPEVIARGFETPDGDGQELLDRARDAVDEVLERCLANRMTEVNLLQQELHDALAPLVHRMTGKRPMVLPVVVEV